MVKNSNASIALAAIIMMSSVLLSRVFGLLREIILARFGGTSFEMDAYVTSFIIPEFMNHFLASGFLSITFIPIFQKYLTEGRERDAWVSFSNLLCIGSVLFLVAIPVAMLFTPDALMLLGPHIRQSENHALTVRLTRIILPAQLFFYWGAFMSAIQMARKRFFLPALIPLVYNAGIIIGGIVLGPFLGIEGFAWGVCFGSFFGNVVLQFPGAIRSGMRFAPKLDMYHPDVKLYMVKTIPLILGLGMSFSTEFFFRFFGSYLPEGGISSVNYALRTMMIVVAVFGQAPGVAFYPFLSKLAAEKKFHEMTTMLNRFLKKIALYLIPASMLLMLLSRQIVSLLYERGRFDHNSTLETATIFSVYLMGSFTFSAAMIVARSFYALQNMVLPMVVSTVISLGTIPLYLYFSRIMGAKGIAFAAVTGMTLQFIVQYLLWNMKFGSLKILKNGIVLLLKIVAISSMVATGGYFLGVVLGTTVTINNRWVENCVEIGMVSLPVFAMTFFLYDICGIQSMRESWRGILNKK